MIKRRLGKTGIEVSEISLGTWQVGGVWGAPFSHENADKILHTAIDAGVNFIDTADVYSDGESEKAVGRVVRQYKEKIYVATKCGRKFNPHNDASYTVSALRKFVEDSLKNMDIETIDLIQLHCMPNDTYYRPEIFELFDRLKEEGKIQHLGVSVEKVEQAIKAMEFDNVTTVQIIFNMFRQRPAELFFDLAKKNDIGILARVPLASGLLSGKYSAATSFEAGDHRQGNRNGEWFDKGETFSGVDYEKGLEAVNALKTHFQGKELAQVALAWILAFEEVSCVIPGASKVEHLVSNLHANEVKLSDADMAFVTEVYNQYIKAEVHQLW